MKNWMKASLSLFLRQGVGAEGSSRSLPSQTIPWLFSTLKTWHPQLLRQVLPSALPGSLHFSNACNTLKSLNALHSFAVLNTPESLCVCNISSPLSCSSLFMRLMAGLDWYFLGVAQALSPAGHVLISWLRARSPTERINCEMSSAKWFTALFGNYLGWKHFKNGVGFRSWARWHR